MTSTQQRTRRDMAMALANLIRTLEQCDPLQVATLQAIERALSDYALVRLTDVRQSIVALTLDANTKQSVLEILAQALHEDTL